MGKEKVIEGRDVTTSKREGCDIESILMDLGFQSFKGKLLEVIKDEDGLYSFYNFIQLNENLSKLMITTKFVAKMKSDSTFSSYDTSIKAFESAKSKEELVHLIARFLKADVTDSDFIELLDMFSDVLLDKAFYSKLVQLRKLYTIREIKTLYQTNYAHELVSDNNCTELFSRRQHKVV